MGIATGSSREEKLLEYLPAELPLGTDLPLEPGQVSRKTTQHQRQCQGAWRKGFCMLGCKLWQEEEQVSSFWGIFIKLTQKLHGSNPNRRKREK